METLEEQIVGRKPASQLRSRGPVLRIVDDYEEIRLDQDPTEKKWKLVPLYKESVAGTPNVWQVGFDGRDRLEIDHGTVGGVIQHKTRLVEPKSRRTMQEQALLNARSRYDKQWRKGYRPTGGAPPIDPKPMLANEWVSKANMQRAKERLAQWRRNPKAFMEDEMVEVGLTGGGETWKVNPKWKTVDHFPAVVQAKLDGVRRLHKLQNDRVVGRSRGEKVTPMPHIEAELIPFFKYLPYGSQLDGEFYSFTLEFQDIQSAYSTKKIHHPKILETSYVIYDIITPEPMPYEERYNLLFNAYKKFLEDDNPSQYIHLLSFTLANNDEEIEAIHRHLVDELKYEGSMIRKLAGLHPTPKTIAESLYESRRSSNLLKHKDIDDDEAIVVGVEEAGGQEEGAAILRLREPDGTEFTVRMRGPVEERRKWFENPKLVMGRKVKFFYNGRTVHEKPRFPRGALFLD